MMKAAVFKLFLRGLLYSIVALSGLALLLCVIEGIEVARTGELRAESSESPKDFQDRISLYSLVSMGVIDVSQSNIETVNRDSPFYSCVGNLREEVGDSFIDVSALTASIAAIESYNRNWFRQKTEMLVQDLLQPWGFSADYTIGVSQIKSSLAEKLYRENINSSASKNEIKKFAREDCGGYRLSAIHIHALLFECEKAMVDEYDLSDLLNCVSKKYTGMNESQREYKIYAPVVVKSYERLFDTSSEFYYNFFLKNYGVDNVNGGLCVEFNVGSLQLAAVPKDKSQDYFARGVPKSDERKATASAEVMLLAINPENDRGLDGKDNSALAEERKKLLAPGLCNRFKAKSIQFASRPDFLPQQLDKYCSVGVAGAVGESSDAYIVLDVAAKFKSANGSIINCKIGSTK